MIISTLLERFLTDLLTVYVGRFKDQKRYININGKSTLYNEINPILILQGNKKEKKSIAGKNNSKCNVFNEKIIIKKIKAKGMQKQPNTNISNISKL